MIHFDFSCFKFAWSAWTVWCFQKSDPKSTPLRSYRNWFRYVIYTDCFKRRDWFWFLMHQVRTICMSRVMLSNSSHQNLRFSSHAPIDYDAWPILISSVSRRYKECSKTKGTGFAPVAEETADCIEGVWKMWTMRCFQILRTKIYSAQFMLQFNTIRHRF